MTGGAPTPGATRLIAITDRHVASARDTLVRFERLARLARPWSVMLQLRDHDLSGRERLEMGRSLRALCAAEQQWLEVNDRLDLALLVAADAVHLGERSVSAADTRALVGAATFVSRACHDAERELEPDVDAWVLSPIFEARKGRGALGLGAVERLRARCHEVAPGRAGGGQGVIALGGVTARNARDAIAAGADGVAVIGAVLASDEQGALVDALGIRR